MSLFEIALQGLSDEEKKQFEEWERVVVEICEEERKNAEAKGVPISRTVIENIHSEVQFDDTYPIHPEKFTEFLRKLVLAYSTSASTGLTIQKFKDLYYTACRESCLLGLHGKLISAGKPEVLLRYEPIRRLLLRIVKEKKEQGLFGKIGMDNYRNLIFGDTWEEQGRSRLAEAYLCNREVNSNGNGEITSNGEVVKIVFVTFSDNDGRVPDESNGAIKLMLALGFPITEADIPVVKMAYRPRHEDILRFPTVADAGWNPYFKPAKESDFYGWTEPIGSSTAKGYPEAVHDNRKIGSLNECPQIIA